MDFDEFEGAPNVMHVSTAGSDTNPANDGSTWAKAKATVAGALAANGNNVLVLVAPGSYTGSFTINGASPTNDANVTIQGAGWGTRIQAGEQFVGVANVQGNNITIQDIQLFNTGADIPINQNFNAIRLVPVGGTADPYLKRLAVRRVSAHGGAALLLISRNHLVTESILDGFENSIAISRFAGGGPSIQEFTVVSSNTICRTFRPSVDYDSEPIHAKQGHLTALNCSFACIAAAPTLTVGYRGLLIEAEQSSCVLFGSTVGVNRLTGVQIQAGASFVGILGNSDARVKTTACAVRAVGDPPAEVASFKATGTGVIIDADWTLRIPP